ncbi:hypothetical protein GCM10027511_16730 [Hymenobacter humi]
MGAAGAVAMVAGTAWDACGGTVGSPNPNRNKQLLTNEQPIEPAKIMKFIA